MNIRTPWSKVSATDTHNYPPSRVKTAGYMPIAKRIDLMIRAGLQMQMSPSCYQFAPGSAPSGSGAVQTVNTPGKNDLVDIKRREDTYMMAHAAELERVAQERHTAAQEAFRKQIIDDYIKTLPAPAGGPPDASSV